MSSRKRIKKLEHDAAMALLAKQNLEHRITQLECEHKHVKWVTEELSGNLTLYHKKCAECGKVLQNYTDKKRWLDAQYSCFGKSRKGSVADVIDPFTGMSERTRQLAEDYVVCLKKNMMNERKAREILGRHITKYNVLRPFVSGDEVVKCVTWHPGWRVADISGPCTADQLKAIAWWMENKGGE